MPTYVYEVIGEDGQPQSRFEIVQSIHDEPLTHHPETGEPVERIICPFFVGGTWSESAMSKNARDEKKLNRLGLTKYVKSGDGVYEKRTGRGPQVITRDQPIKPTDLK